MSFALFNQHLQTLRNILFDLFVVSFRRRSRSRERELKREKKNERDRKKRSKSRSRSPSPKHKEGAIVVKDEPLDKV